MTRWRKVWRGPRRDRGAATAELALALPVVALVIAAGLHAVAAGIDRIRCVDAARVVARSLARGDPLAASLEMGQRLAPPGSAIATAQGAGSVIVTVDARRPSRWPLPALVVSARAEAARERAP